MPELPEVETIRADLARAAVGRRVVAAHVRDRSVVRAPPPDAFETSLRGRTIQSAARRGKYLLLRLDDGRSWALHLSLEGRLLLTPRDAPVAEGTRLTVTLDDDSDLRLWDRVSFATTALGDDAALDALYHLDLLGPEPTEAGFTEALLRERFEGRRGRIKPLLLEQRVIAGVGNIYADESLWRASIHPERKVDALTDAEWSALHRALVDTLTEGVAHRGTTAPGGLYRDLFGRKGEHQSHLAVFRRAGKACPRCGATVERSEVGGRSTFFCPSCQHLEGVAPRLRRVAVRSHPVHARPPGGAARG